MSGSDLRRALPLVAGVAGAAAILWFVRPVTPVPVAPPRTVQRPPRHAPVRPPPRQEPRAEPASVADASVATEPDAGVETFQPQPAVVLVAEAADRPLLRYQKRGRWSLKADGRDSVKVEDAGFALPGGRYDAYEEGPAELRGAPTLLAIGAGWCAPCVAELADLVNVAARLRDEVRARFVFVSVDGSAGRAGLSLAVEDLFARHNRATNRDKPLEPPSWAVFRSDPRWGWAKLLEPLSARQPFREDGVPLTMLFDACGDLLAVVQERLDADARHAIEGQLPAVRRSLRRCGADGKP